MSFLGFGGSAQPQLSSQQKVQAAEAELDLVTDMFNKLVDNCQGRRTYATNGPKFQRRWQTLRNIVERINKAFHRQLLVYIQVKTSV